MQVKGHVGAMRHSTQMRIELPIGRKQTVQIGVVSMKNVETVKKKG